MELTEKIRAVLDEDERLAQEAIAAACGATWRASDSGIYPEDNPSQHPGPFLADAYGHTGSYGEHIARHDPARVLRQVTAMRKILDEHPVSAHPPYDCMVCGDSIRDVDTLPCPTLLALAEAYGIEP